MALPAGVSKLGSLAVVGPPGTFATAEAVTVPAGSPADVEMFGPQTARGVRFYVPRGLPAVGAADDDEAIATYVSGEDTATRAAIDAYAGPGAMANPETPLNGATREIAFEVLTLGAPGIPYVFDGALSANSAPRPVWQGPVIWQVWAGNPTPSNFDASKGDQIELVKVASATGLPGFADEFAGPAGSLYATELGRKLYEVANRTAVGAVQASRNGSGRAGFLSGSGGNATAVAQGNAANGTLRLRLAGVVSGAAGITLRYLDNANYLYVTRRDSSVQRVSLFQVVAGTSTLLAQASSDAGLVSSGREMTVTMAGDGITVFMDGVQQVTFTTSLFNTATKHGLYGIPSVGSSYFAESLVFEAA